MAPLFKALFPRTPPLPYLHYTLYTIQLITSSAKRTSTTTH
jgi:hypothetical protein